jgi:glycerol uptake facilitator-like aquaporin
MKRNAARFGRHLLRSLAESISSWVSMRSAAAEALGTALLLAAVVGSGIMAERLAGGNEAIALLANSLATGFALIALIVAFAERSGAHFNPVVTLALAVRRDLAWSKVPGYLVAQAMGALAGVALAHVMFDLPLMQTPEKIRAGIGQWTGELIATFGLVFLILSLSRKNAWAAPFAVGGYIAAAYWFTSSTSFANPAVTLARGFTDTFAGIGLANVPAFVIFQVLGAALALVADRALRENR